MYLTKSPKTAFRVIDGEVVIVDVTTSMLYSLNPLATFIWEMCDGNNTVNDIVGKIEDEYEVEKDVAEKDCMEFVHDFVGKGLLLGNDEK